MLKDHDPPKEPLQIIAERKWRNNAIRKRLTEERQKPRLVDPNAEPEPADVIVNDGRRDGPRRRFERQFLKDIRSALNEHQLLNLKIYKAAIEHRRYLLLKEKLRRLQVAQQEVAK